MSGGDTVVRTKFIAPRLRRFYLDRPRLRTRLAGLFDHPLTILRASAGYGKSTSLAAFLAVRPESRVWYSASETEAEPGLFALNLVHALRSVYPDLGERTLQALENAGSDCQPNWAGAIDVLVNEMLDGLTGETVVVLDDFHLPASSPEVLELCERLIRQLPPNVHLVLSTRKRPAFRSLGAWRVKGQLLELGEDDLAFEPGEIAELFSTQYGHELTPEQVSEIGTHTEGWVIALEMVWYALQSDVSLDRVWAESSDSLASLFDYLAQEVLQNQPPATVDFLTRTSVLSVLEAPACDFLMETADSSSILKGLESNGLFLVGLGAGAYRLHPLFHDFLRRQTSADSTAWNELNRLAGDYFLNINRITDAVSHYMAAGQFCQAARVLSERADDLNRQGRLDTVSYWVAQLPGEVLDQYPALLVARGDSCRQRSQFDEALDWYRRGESAFREKNDQLGMSRALQGMARVYLDTIQPAEAETFLHRAFKLLGREQRWEKALLLKMMAENKTNLGEHTTAERLQRAAHDLLHEAMESELDVRLYLRTGRLAAAQSALERRLRDDDPGGRAPLSHREAPLLLSLVYAIIGEPERSLECARAGQELGVRMKSPFVEAVAYMRLGHARQLSNHRETEEAARCYLKALELTDALHVERGRAEPLMGLCLLYGFGGDLPRAERCAEEAIEIARRARDHWMGGLVELAMAAVVSNAIDSPRAFEWLVRARKTFTECGDAYGIVVTQFWEAYLYLRTGREEEYRKLADVLFQSTQIHGYEFLFTHRTLFGPRDSGIIVPMLIEARHAGIRTDYVSWLLAVLGLPKTDSHPGYTLYIQTLGSFHVWRGSEEIAPKDWQREKARQLLQLFLTHRRELLNRDQIIEMLWPDLDPETAGRDLKVVMNALNNALEPYRSPRATPFYIMRHGSSYGLNLSAGYWLDVEEFESLAAKGRALAEARQPEAMELFRQAVDLYKGDYLAECLYDDWSSAERERLLALYLRTGSQFARMLAENEAYEESIDVCEKVLARDRCWEEAYRLLMFCYFKQGRRPSAIRTFEKCRQTLQEELGIEPMADTVRLYQQIAGPEAHGVAL